MVKRIAIYVCVGLVVLIVASWLLFPLRGTSNRRGETYRRCKNAMTEALLFHDRYGRWPTNITEIGINYLSTFNNPPVYERSFRKQFNSEGNWCDAWDRPLMLEVNEKDRKVTIWSYGYNGVNDGKTNNINVPGGGYADDIVLVIEYSKAKEAKRRE
jgi:hypothetical protein